MEKVELKVTKDEALVLFELLSRFSEEEKLSIQDQAEKRALWNLTGALEKALTEPFSSNWSELIEAARGRLRDDD